MAGQMVALLRGINVGGKHIVPMAELRQVLGAAGYVDVRTYIQSGNVVFRPPQGMAAGAVAVGLSELIAGHFGFPVPVVVRTGEELAAVQDSSPFLAEGVDPKHLHVGFLQQVPTAAAAAGLDPARSPGDRFAVVGREIYLHVPGGMARTKLTNVWFDRQLGVTSTFRNWRTLGKLAAMVA